MGTGVLGGMLAATVLAVAFVPLFYLWMSRRSGRGREIDEETLPGLPELQEPTGGEDA